MITDKQAEFIFNKLNKIDKGLAIDFANAGDKDKWLVDNESVLEGKSEYTDNYRNLGELRGDKYKLLNDFYSEQGGKSPSAARIFSFRNKHPEISEDEIKGYFDKVNEYKEQEERQRDYEAGVKRRSDEVKKDWPWYSNILTSEYEKERYIKEPEKAIFGKEAPLFGDAPETRYESLFDFGMGAAGAAGDFIPSSKALLLGPAIRTARDIYHGASDSKYKKHGTDYISDFGTDLASNAAIAFLPNLRTAKRASNAALGKDIGKVLDFQDELAATKKNLEMLDGRDVFNMKNSELYTAIDNMAESDLKTALKKYAPSMTNMDREKISLELTRAKVQLEAAKEGAAKANKVIDNIDDYAAWTKLDPKELPPGLQMPSQRVDAVFGTGLGKKLSELPKLSKLQKNVGVPVSKGMRKFLNNDEATGVALREAQNAGLISGKKSSPVEGPDENLIRQWLLGFRPKEMPGDPMWEQYVRWRDDYNKKYGKEFGEIE